MTTSVHLSPASVAQLAWRLERVEKSLPPPDDLDIEVVLTKPETNLTAIEVEIRRAKTGYSLHKSRLCGSYIVESDPTN